MQSRYRVWLLPLLAGCASTSSSNVPHLDFVSDAYTLQPGDEKYFCYTINLPADRDVVITRLEPDYGAGTHHILFSQALAPEPTGVSECAVLSKATWLPLYAGGKDSGPLELPAHTGFKPFARGQQLVMQLHLQNAGDAPMTHRTSMRIEYVDATPDITPAGVYGLDNHRLVIPPHSQDALTEMSCLASRDLDVFAVLGHMHKRGIHLDFSRGETAGAEMLYDEKWNFDTQPVIPVSFNVKQNERLHLRCTHQNETEVPIIYGESSDTEMCAIAIYYTPFGGPDGCTQK
jgi:hypothetical protein